MLILDEDLMTALFFFQLKLLMTAIQMMIVCPSVLRGLGGECLMYLKLYVEILPTVVFSSVLVN